MAPDASAVFSVSATASSSMTYQWRKDGVDLIDSFAVTGTTTAQLTITNVSQADAGAYSVVVTSACGAATSGGAILSVAGSSCLADITGIGGPPAIPDGLVTGDDFNAFISAFASGDLLADVTGIGGPPAVPDGLITGDDFNAFIASFAAGCP